ncbi:hypothetical protein F5Y08DRAFT_180362 [Xylaria arbuscula]|nr:hypothetical protein F5Y08DRAFT_180362 [Xylaria arbuscula]
MHHTGKWHTDAHVWYRTRLFSLLCFLFFFFSDTVDNTAWKAFIHAVRVSIGLFGDWSASELTDFSSGDTTRAIDCLPQIDILAELHGIGTSLVCVQCSLNDLACNMTGWGVPVKGHLWTR